MILTCLSAVILNLTPLPFNQQDMATLNRAVTEVCQKDARYGGCLARFTKSGKNSYQVSCGDKQEFDDGQYKKDVDKQIDYELRYLSAEKKEAALKKIGR